MKRKIKPKDNKGTFPTITIDLSINYLDKVVHKHKGRIIAYEDIGKAIKKSGGNLSRITNSLNEFGLIDKSSVGKWMITDLGMAIIRSKNPDDILRAFLKPEIHAKLWNTYKGERPSISVLQNDVKKITKIEEKRAKKLAKVFLKSFDSLENRGASLEPSSVSESDIQTLGHNTIDKDVYKMAIRVGKMFSEFSEDLENDVEDLKKFAESHGMKKLLGQLEVVSNTLTFKKSEEDKKEYLKHHAKLILKTFEEELKLV